MEQEKYCLVLSGGGAKGVYHIGAWQALRELNISLEAVVGNSIGAVIATFVAQDLHAELEDIGSRIALNYVLDVPAELMEDGELSINLKKRKAFRDFYRNTTSKRGLDTSPLKNLMEQYIDENRIRNSGIDFGVVAYNVSDMKPREVFIEEMEEGEVVNYAMASSAFPGFQSPEIAGKKYIDGGVYDNIPFAMAKCRGYHNIIVVDISGAGVNRKPDIQGVRTIYVKNSINMGGVLDFNRKFMDDYTLLGYLDTMKAFGRLRGIDYFIEPDEKIEKAFVKFMETDEIRQKVFALSATGLHPRKAPSSPVDAVRRLLPKKRRYDPCWLPIFADCAAKSLAVERIRKWNYENLFDSLLERESEVRTEAKEMGDSGSREFITRIRKDLKGRRIITTPYVYHLMSNRYLPKRLNESLDKFLIDHYPELKTGVFFLEIIDGFRNYLNGARI